MAIPQRDRASPWPFLAMAGMASAFFLYAASAVLAPWWAVAALMVVWLVLFARACRWWSSHPVRMLALPVVAVALWLAVLVAGAHWLGWTA